MDSELTPRRKAEGVMTRWKSGLGVGEPGLIDAITTAIQKQSNEDLARHRKKCAALEAQLAVANERCAGLAAALEVGERTIAEAMKAASAMNLDRAGCLLSAYVLCGKDYSAILADLRERERRAGKIEAYKDVGCTCAISPKNPLFREHFKWCPLAEAAELEAQG